MKRLLLCLSLLLCACASRRYHADVPRRIDAEEVPAAIRSAEEALAEGDTDLALAWLRLASDVEGLPTEQRNRVQMLVENTADRRIDELSARGGDPDALVELLDMDLPRQIAVTAGMRAARRMVDEGELDDAYDLLRRLDREFPFHHERAAAGGLLARIGLELSHDDSGFWFFWRARDEGYSALEYVTLNYPSEPRGDECYARLAEMYEEDERWELAIENHEDLILHYPSSPFVPHSEARIPHLRMASLESPEYDRVALETARDELEDWLQRHGAVEGDMGVLEREVRLDLADALRRLAESDLGIASFYRRVDAPGGARLHAARALGEARLAGDESRVERARGLLDALPEDAPPAADEPPPGPPEGEAEGSGT